MIAKTLRRRLAVGTALSLAFVATPALAQLVSSGDLVGATDSAGNPGQISISNPNATTANISVLAPAVIANWTRFNAPDGTTVNITNASAGSEAALLNRVIGGTFSDLGGTINATGVNLWVLNSNGILFGGNTSVNAKSFHASTLGVTDADFFDFYEGTDNAGNGSATINFSGAGSTAIVSPAGASFTTDGTLLFAGPSLGLSGDFDAGSGRAVFVSATNFSINNSPGSPLTYTISAGTTVAGMLVGGTVQGQSADFLHVTAAGVVGALLQVDADVATTAIATDRGILLGALSVGAPQPDFVANGSLTTSGAVLTSLSGDATFNDAVTGASVGLAGVDVTTQAVTATAGDIDIDGSSISTGLLQASDDIFVDSSGAISLAGASADNDASGAGSLRIGNGSSPVSVTVTGAAQGASVDIFSNGDAILGNVTSTAGLIDIDAGGGLNAGAISANGGNASVTAAGGIVATSIGSTGNLDIDSTGGGNLSVGNLTAGMEIALDTSGTVTGGTVNAGGMLTVGASTVPGAATFTGNIIADGVDIQASGNLNLQGVTSTGGMIDLDSSFGAISAGAVSATGSASLTAFLGITTTSTSSGAAIDIDSTGGGNLSLGNLNAGATIALDTAGTAALGAATAGGAFNVGASIDPSTLTIAGNVSAGSVDFDVTGALVANSITATAGDIDIDAGSVAADFITATDDVFVDSTGAVTLSGAQADSDSSGAGNLAIGATTAPASVTVAGGSLQGVAVTVQGVGDFYFGSSPVTSTGGAVELDSATGEIVAGVVSATGGNASLTAGGRLFLGNVTAGADVTFDTPGSLDFGNVSAGGTFAIGGTLVPFFVSATGVVNAATLTSNTTGGLSLDGANSIASLGNITAGGVLSINSITDLALGGLVSAPGQYISIRSAGDLTVNAGGRVVGRLIAFSAADNFINNRGADAITASDHWVVYSSAPAGNVFGGLDSGNTAIWNRTVGTLHPSFVTGNRYVFAFQPTLTVSSTDLSKVYGTDLTGALNANYSASGLQPGVAGAFLGDTLGGILSGTPSITSTGSAANADVLGGPYVMTVNQGSLAVANGYQLVLSNAGRLTITPKALTATVNVFDKTYDGNTNGLGSIAVGGLVSGDQVTIAGTTYTFSDKNAGTDKTVTVSGATLTGADASNYTMTVPATVLADILAKAIGANVSANNKTYDGTTGATGSVTLTGVVAGDSVGTTGTVFAFSDKNAGIDKTVNVSGTVLTGADAGNYTLTVPASVLADIFAKMLGATVTANDKTYDGTTAATGSVALTGVVAGDSVGTSGTTLTFANENAGTDKSVIVSGTTLTGADAGNYTLTVPAVALADVFAKAIGAVVSANDKTYDGTTAGSGFVSLTGVVAGDSVGTAGTTFTFGDKNAGVDKTVNVSGTFLTGADAGNYVLTVPASALADIFAKAIGATVSANDKTYDGTTAASGSVSLTGVVAGDSVGTSGTTFAFSNKNAGADKTVNVSGTTLTGADAGNYVLTVPASALADILAKAIGATVTANDKTYDGTTAASGSVALTGVVAGDSVGTSGSTFTFSDKNAGVDKTVTIGGATLTGADAGNYVLTVPASALADIFAKAITGTVTANDKTYDGSTAGSGSVALSGVVAGDAVAGAATFTFADKNAGADKTVAVSGATLAGADAGNYTLTVPASALADILQRLLVIAANDQAKAEGSADPALTYSVGGQGLVSGDSLSGALEREAGEAPGAYAIEQGTLTAGGNYVIDFEAGTLTITDGSEPPTEVGPNPLRALRLPGDLPVVSGGGSGVELDASGVCPAEDEACQAGS